MSEPASRLLALIIACVAAACAPTIPATRLQTSPSAYVGATVSPCRMMGEVTERRLYEGTATASLEEWHTGIGSIVIRHPKGIAMIDPAFGRSIADDLRKSPPWFAIVMGTARGKKPVLQLLEDAGIDHRDVKFALLSHAHWDHAGALRDLPKAKVLMDEREFKFARARRGYLDHGTMKHHFDIAALRFEPFEMNGPPYEGFPASHDVFGDGAVVAVPTRGHTPGSTSYFINAPDGQRYLYVGDASWTLEGIKRPVNKNPLASAVVDYDREEAAKTLGVLHAFMEQRPDVKVIPAHDFAAMSAIPECTQPK